MLHVSEGGDVGGPDGGQVVDCLLTQAGTRGPGLLGRPGAQLGAGPLLYRHLRQLAHCCILAGRAAVGKYAILDKLLFVY